MKFTQPMAVSIAALLCTASLALAQAPDKGGPGGGASQAPAEKMEKGQPGGGSANRAQESKQPSRDMSQSGERNGAEKGKRAEGRDQSRGKSAETDRGKDQGKAARKEESRKDQKDKAARTDRDKDQNKAARTERDKDQNKAARTDREKDQNKAARTDRDKDQGKAAQAGKDGKAQNANRVQASQEQHTQVRQRLLQRGNVERTRINVSVNIGTRIPHSVRLHPVSSVIIDVAPVYRGYSYIVLEDETICIVDPKTYVIVDVIPASTQRADRGHGARLTLSSDQRSFLLGHIDRHRRADVSVRLGLGVEIPNRVEVVSFPEPVIERIPELRTYRYIVVEDQVVIVNPDDRQVALIVNE